MAIHKQDQGQEIPEINTNPNPSPRQAIPDAETLAQQAPPVQPQMPYTFDWMGHLDGVYQVNQSGSSISLSQLDEAIHNLAKTKIAPDLNIETILLDKSTHVNLGASVLVIVVSPDPNRYNLRAMAYHALMLESSIDHLPPKTFNTAEGTIELIQTPADLYDQTMVSIIGAKVFERYSHLRDNTGTQIPILDASCEVVPKSYQTDDVDTTRKILVNALLACRTKLALVDSNYHELNLAQANYSTSTLVQTIKIGREEVSDIYGRPVRADLRLVTEAKTSNTHGANSRVITESTGYIDLLYNETERPMVPGYGPYFPQGRLYLQPVFVITSLNNYRVQTLAGVLQALVNISAIQDSGYWLNSLMPSPGNNDEWHDVGSIGYDIPLNPQEPSKLSKLDTSPANFTFEDLRKVHDTYFHPGLGFMIDVPNCGPSTWMLEDIVASAYGDQDAINRITTAADILTNGAFSRVYQVREPYFYRTNYKVLLGSYVRNVNGVPNAERDIRDVDYLSVCRHYGPSERNVIATYTDSQNNPNGANPIKLAHYSEMIKTSMLGASAKFYGFAERLCISNTFLQALVTACSEARYHVVSQSATSTFGISTRSNAGYINSSVMSPFQVSSIFTNGAQAHQETQGYVSRYARR